jgi:hypothetical protein
MDDPAGRRDPAAWTEGSFVGLAKRSFQVA